MLNMNIVSTQYYKRVFNVVYFPSFIFQDCELFVYHPKAKFNTSKIKNTRQQQQHKLHITKQHITTASKNFGGRKKNLLNVVFQTKATRHKKNSSALKLQRNTHKPESKPSIQTISVSFYFNRKWENQQSKPTKLPL